MIMQNTPLASVLMTVYNREKYIAEAIESVLASSYTNFELIIVDDCSKDKSLEIAKTYKDERITIYVNEANLGQFQNRNKAAEYAKGKYIKYLDSDDIIYPHGLEVMVEAMEKFPEAAYAIPGKSNDIKPFPFLCNGKQNVRKHFTHEPIFIFGPSALIFRTDTFIKIKKFGDDTYVGSDIDILLNLAAKYSFIKMSPAQIWWRIHEEQEINKGTLNYDYFYNYFNKMVLFLGENKSIFSKNEYSIALKKLRNLYIGKILRLIINAKFMPVKKFLLNNPLFLKLLITQ